MGKKVKIPITKAEDEPIESAEELTVETENPVFEEDEGSEDGDESIFGDSVEGDAGEKGKITGLDSSFADRDVDFSGLEDPSAGEDSGPELARLKSEVDGYQQKYLRALADLDNFRKRAQKEKSDLLKYQGEKILVDIVDVLDNLELALDHKGAEIESLRTGVEMIHQQFIDALGRWGVRAETAVGGKFDPNRQNAINRVPTPDAEPGSVVAELKKTYFYKDKLLRVGEVVVAAEAEDAENNDKTTAQE